MKAQGPKQGKIVKSRGTKEWKKEWWKTGQRKRNAEEKKIKTRTQIPQMYKIKSNTYSFGRDYFWNTRANNH